MFTKNANKQRVHENIIFLNKLELFKNNKLLACNPVYMHTRSPLDIGDTFCDIYSRRTKKRVTLNTRVLFSKNEFIENPCLYLSKYLERLS